MKRIISDGGFESMLGEKIELWCGVYIYTGVVVGVNDDHLELSPASVVYNTGRLDADKYEDVQELQGTRRVMFQAVESWGPGR